MAPSTDSTGCSCCNGFSAMLASHRMLNLTNPARCLRHGAARSSPPPEASRFPCHPACPELARHGGRTQSEPGRPKAEPPRSTVSRAWGIRRNEVEGSASGHWVDALGIMSTKSAKLDFFLSLPISSTSKFLIDNFQQVSSRAGEHISSASFASWVSCISNRHIPRLEMPVSCRKQRITPLSNRPQFAFFNFHDLRDLSALKRSFHLPPLHHVLPLPPHLRSRLLTFDSFTLRNEGRLPSLIANETHSREESNNWKQSTYQFLIANEFHSQNAQNLTQLNLGAIVQ